MPSDPPSLEWLDQIVEQCCRAHSRLAATVAPLDEDAVRRPSLLPGWRVGHVLTHLARNADSFLRMLEGAAAGETLEQYDGGPARRAADIDAGAERAAEVIVADVMDTMGRLEACWRATGPDTWCGEGRTAGSPWPCWTFPHARWREVEVHHADLGLGYTRADWPSAYVTLELPGALGQLPGRLDGPTRAQLLAWLMGRAEQPAMTPAAWQSRPEYYHSSL